MADIIYPNCKQPFDMNNANSLVTRTAAAAAGGTGGAIIGAECGVVGGLFGAVNGLWIGAAVGAGAGWLAADQFCRCPHCGKIFKT
ncbi:MAG TPA: hypothetical protein VHY22_07245 [Chthoniobacteraceae bacterium]|jgi:uncharacterized protein YcfJ|nr:hypothetical protein [Chthoniobacteraceae bacterium]